MPCLIGAPEFGGITNRTVMKSDTRSDNSDQGASPSVAARLTPSLSA